MQCLYYYFNFPGIYCFHACLMEGRKERMGYIFRLYWTELCFGMFFFVVECDVQLASFQLIYSIEKCQPSNHIFSLWVGLLPPTSTSLVGYNKYFAGVLLYAFDILLDHGKMKFSNFSLNQLGDYVYVSDVFSTIVHSHTICFCSSSSIFQLLAP